MKLPSMTDETGEMIFEKGFGEFIEKNCRLISDLLQALGLLRSITGIENLVEATTENDEDEKRRARLGDLLIL